MSYFFLCLFSFCEQRFEPQTPIETIPFSFCSVTGSVIFLFLCAISKERKGGKKEGKWKTRKKSSRRRKEMRDEEKLGGRIIDG